MNEVQYWFYHHLMLRLVQRFVDFLMNSISSVQASAQHLLKFAYLREKKTILDATQKRRIQLVLTLIENIARFEVITSCEEKLHDHRKLTCL